MKNNINKQNKKIFLITVIILSILILQLGIVNAQPNNLEDCNNAGEIWCDNLPVEEACQERSGYYYGSDVICEINSEQDIDTKQQSMWELHNYHFKELEVKENGALIFLTTTATSNDAWDGYFGGGFSSPEAGLGAKSWKLDNQGGGDGGDGGLSDSSNAAPGGGGGAGGQHVSLGGFGGLGGGGTASSGTTFGEKGERPTKAGAKIRIFAEELTINGKISTNGEEGGDGGPGEAVSDGTFSSDKRSGGGGGAGGSGAGDLYLVGNIHGTGTIETKGGDGGRGGDAAKSAGSGGGGGGGRGGSVYFFTQTDEDNINLEINTTGGRGGDPGDLTDGGFQGEKGEDGDDGEIRYDCLDEPGPCGLESKFDDKEFSLIEKKIMCNNKKDDDSDGLIDMDDVNCRDVEEWDSTLWGLYVPKPDWYNRSAPDGRDLVCGDDVPLYEGTCSGEIDSEDDFCSNYDDTSGCLGRNGCELNNEDFLTYTLTEDPCGPPPEDISCLDDDEEIGSDTVYCSWQGQDGHFKNTVTCEINSFSARTLERSIPSSTPCGDIETEMSCPSNFDLISNITEEVTCQQGPSQSSKEVMTSIQCEPRLSCVSEEHDDKSCDEFTNKFDCKQQGCDWEDNKTNLKTLGDLGFITPRDDIFYGRFACFDNSLRFVTSLEEHPVRSPGLNYSWRDASYHPGILMMAHDTMFTSNIDEWFFCNAMGHNFFDLDYSVDEYRTFPASPNMMEPLCTHTLATLNIFDDYQIDVCDDEPYICRDDFEDGWGVHPELFFVYCPSSLTHDLGASDEFRDQCGVCEVYSEGEWYSLNEFLSGDVGSSFLEFYCDKFPYDPICSGEGDDSDTDIIDQDDCINPDDCLGEAIDSSMTCGVVHDTLDYDYPDDDTFKFCDTSSQFCKDGFLFNSTDSNGGICCVGQNAYCENYDGNCAAIGGQTFSDPEICLGYVVGENENCCIGRVTLSLDEILQSYVRNDSYMCYKDAGRSFFKECCGVTGCFNTESYLRPSLGVVNAFVMDGVPLHSLLNYDDGSMRGLLQVLNHDTNSNYTGYAGVGTYDTDHIMNPLVFIPGGKGYEGKGYDFTNFDYMHFDFATNNRDALDKFVLIDVDGNRWEFDLGDVFYSSNFRWQHVIFKLENPPNNFNEELVRRVEFSFKGAGTVGFLFDNLFLRAEEDESLDFNSEPRFCSGNWGSWVENLDGPTDEGWFFDDDLPERSVFGPYQGACDGVISYAWTGSVCCGDDTLPDNYGEYWIDTNGMCWEGVPVRHDFTLAYALSKDYAERPLRERGLLFFADAPHLCEVSPDNFSGVNFSFDGKGDDSYTDFESVLSVVDPVGPFAIRGSWICQPEQGWVKIEELDRIAMLAAFLLDIAGNYSENLFTLHCAEPDKAVNLGFARHNLTGSICSLRTGPNHNLIGMDSGLGSQVSGRVFVAFESKDIFSPLANNLEEVFALFPFLDDYNWDCSNAPLNPDFNNFFTKCDTEESDFRLYHNKPLNLFLLSEINIEKSFFASMWDALVGFFQNLFGGSSDESFDTISLGSFSDYAGSSELYFSKQLEREIVGKSESVGGTHKIRVDYTNLHTNVSFLANMLETKHQDKDKAAISWVPQGFTQTIFGQHLEGLLFDFNDITSFLRLRHTTLLPTDFGFEENCTVKDSSGEQKELLSRHRIFMFLDNEPTDKYCQNLDVNVVCEDGQLFVDNEPMTPSDNGIFEFTQEETQDFEFTQEETQEIGDDLSHNKLYFECEENCVIPNLQEECEKEYGTCVCGTYTWEHPVFSDCSATHSFSKCNSGYKCENFQCVIDCDLPEDLVAQCIQEHDVCECGTYTWEHPVLEECMAIHSFGKCPPGFNCDNFECVESDDDNGDDDNGDEEGSVWEYYSEEQQTDFNTCNHWGDGMWCSTQQAGSSCTPFDECIISTQYTTVMGDGVCFIEGLICN